MAISTMSRSEQLKHVTGDWSRAKPSEPKWLTWDCPLAPPRGSRSGTDLPPGVLSSDKMKVKLRSGNTLTWPADEITWTRNKEQEDWNVVAYRFVDKVSREASSTLPPAPKPRTIQSLIDELQSKLPNGYTVNPCGYPTDREDVSNSPWWVVTVAGPEGFKTKEMEICKDMDTLIMLAHEHFHEQKREKDKTLYFDEIKPGAIYKAGAATASDILSYSKGFKVSREYADKLKKEDTLKEGLKKSRVERFRELHEKMQEKKTRYHANLADAVSTKKLEEGGYMLSPTMTKPEPESIHDKYEQQKLAWLGR